MTSWKVSGSRAWSGPKKPQPERTPVASWVPVTSRRASIDRSVPVSSADSTMCAT
ncbi:hypothetical protein ACFYO5_19135 [Streptomyces sp. NPDC006259]|uniref:hypothetical protein n=1 Tax=Streptomyces sp. NPDC006259 TaxID=3364740 RepID=UPI00369F4BC3